MKFKIKNELVLKSKIAASFVDHLPCSRGPLVVHCTNGPGTLFLGNTDLKHGTTSLDSNEDISLDIGTHGVNTFRGK